MAETEGSTFGRSRSYGHIALLIPRIYGIMGKLYSSPSSSGLGRRPFKAEITGSNPVGGTSRNKALLCGEPFLHHLAFAGDVDALWLYREGKYAYHHHSRKHP